MSLQLKIFEPTATALCKPIYSVIKIKYMQNLIFISRNHSETINTIRVECNSNYVPLTTFI